MISPTLQTTRFTSPKISGKKDCERLETALSPLDGVVDVSVDPDGHTVCVSYNADVVDKNGIMSVLQDSGYRVESSTDIPTPSEAMPTIVT